MEGKNRSSSGVVKNRSSSGCLIIKKKVDSVIEGGSSKGSNLHESKKVKKRGRMNVDESNLSDDDEFIELYSKRGVPGRREVMGGSIGGESNNGFEKLGFGVKRELDVYDFDEYDDLSDVEMMRMRGYYDGGVGGGVGGGGGGRRFVMGVEKSGGGVEFDGGGVSKGKGDIIYKRRNSFRGGCSSSIDDKRRFEMRSEGSFSMRKDKFGACDDAIRLQGKNGVLKVRVKHKDDGSDKVAPSYVHGKGSSVASRSRELSSKKVVVGSSPCLEKNVAKREVGVDRLDKNLQRKRKTVVDEGSEESDEEGEDEDSDSPLKLEHKSVEVQGSTKRGRSGGSGSTQSPQTPQSMKLKEGKVRRGSGTEKQLLREKIRTMLINAGWTIDYRPRRGRDYSDAVYVNPAGTAFWSIIKAYDALQKQLEEEGVNSKASEDCFSFALISEDVLSTLTRQTRKKMEKELKRKKKEENSGKRKKKSGSGYFDDNELDSDSRRCGRQDDRLSSFMKHSGKSLKGASKDLCGDGSNSDSKMQEGGEKLKKSKKIGRCMLLVRNSGKGFESEADGFVPYTGKRNLLSWLIDCGTVKLSEKVHYMNRRCTRVMLEGWITREGIHCGCCSKILTVSKFELHAGSKLRQPYQNIYLSSGASLMQCQIDAWNKQEESLRNGYNTIDVNGDDPNDDTCAMCGDGGNLICCDSCPSTFHQSCLGIEMLPPGDWHCPHCSCKFCGLADMSAIEGNDRRQDPVLICCLCEGKYHCSCVEEMDGTMMNSSSPPFCGKTCQELSERLLKLLGVKHEMESGLFWSLIHRIDLGSDPSVRGSPQRVEWNSKLAVALNVMDECFLPINDRRSGINMIHSVLYNSGSNFTRLNYSGFYTAILEKGDEIVSAASIRIHGIEFAEMPYIGTRHIYRRQGMCRQLFSGIESALRSLKVEKLIIPAISELMDTWTTVFGFCTLNESDKQKLKLANMLVFPGTDILQKKLYDKDTVKKGSAGASSLENGSNASIMPRLTSKSEVNSSPGPSSPAAEPENEEIKDKSVTDIGSEDIVHTAELGASYCREVQSLPIENEEMKDKSVTDIGSKDIVHTDKLVASYSHEVQSLPTENEEMKDKSVTDIGSEDIVHTAEIGASSCHEIHSLPTENEEKKDKSVTDIGSEDIVHTAELGASYCHEDQSLPAENEMNKKLVAGSGSKDLVHASELRASDNHEEVPSLPTENKEMVDKSVGDSASGEDEISLCSASADCFKEVEHCMATENEEMKNKSSAADSENVVCKDKHEVVETPLPTVHEEMKDNSVSDFCSEQMICEDETSLPNASADVCEEVNPSIPSAFPPVCNDDKSTESEEMKCKFVNNASEQMICADENSLPNASADCCKEVKPQFPTNSLHDYNDDLSIQSEDMKDKSISSDLVDCLEEVTPSLATALPCVSDDNKAPLQAVINEANLLNGGCMRITSSELQSDVKFNESDVDVKDTGTCETGNALDNSNANCKLEVLFDGKMIQAANLAVAKSESLPRDDEMITTASDGVLNSLKKSIIEAQSQSLSESKDDSLPDPSRIDVEMEKPMVESPAEVDIHHCPEAKLVEDSHKMSGETDGCSGTQSLHVSENISINSADEPEMDVSRNDDLTNKSPQNTSDIKATLDDVTNNSPQNTSDTKATLDDVTNKSPQNTSDSIAAIEKPQHELPTFEGEINHVEVANDQPSNNFSQDTSANPVN